MTVENKNKPLILTDIDTVKRLLSAAGFSFQKSLGQNFITDESVCPEMVRRSLITQTDEVLEIGPGIGVLTTELAKAAKNVVSVEVDTRLIPVLAKTLNGLNNTQVICDDFMKLDLNRLLNEHFTNEKIHVCANLPYYITSPIMMKLFEHRERLDSMTLMVQKEAAERLTAKVGSRESGAITVAVNYYAQAQTLFEVDNSSFTPPPKVDSAVIHLKVRQTPAITVKNEAFFFEVVRAAFSQRRKTAANGLSSLLNMAKSDIFTALEKADLPNNVRAEALSMAQLGTLADILYEMRHRDG